MALIVAAILTFPWIHQALVTVSTDDAYVNGHVTSVAARVPGQVARVLVDDNNRVHKGDLLVELDKEPYQIAVDQKKAAVATAKADVAAAIAQVRSLEGQTRSARYKLQHAIDNVDNQIELLKTNVASLDSARAIRKRAQSDVDRAKAILKTGAIAPEEFDRRQQVLAVAEAEVKEALQGVFQTRVSLGLPAQPEGGGDDLSQVPPDLDQTEPSVRQAQYEVLQNAAQLGVEFMFDRTPKEMIAEFLRRDPQGNIDRIYAELLTTAPAVKQAQAKLAQTERDLAQAELDLRYCDVVSEIDGVVTRRNVNPGNNVVAGQALMAVRSLREIWVDANFKETQLANLRIGQRVDLDVDTYGSRHVFAGHISGFTFGTGSTLALLPAQNATGNFVKVVQRLPVRIELDDYDPDKVPLFVGLSVTPHVYVKEPPSGPNAGKVLQPNEILPVPISAASQPSTQP
jgi:membrane fusion protein (multidrug efflux system)